MYIKPIDEMTDQELAEDLRNRNYYVSPRASRDELVKRLQSIRDGRKEDPRNRDAVVAYDNALQAAQTAQAKANALALDADNAVAKASDAQAQADRLRAEAHKLEPQAGK